MAAGTDDGLRLWSVKEFLGLTVGGDLDVLLDT